MEFSDILTATGETILMTLISGALAFLVGVPLGVLLYSTGKSGLHRNRIVNLTLGVFVNILRSIPCLLLIVILLPLTRAIIGRGTGEWYVIIIPLFVSAFPFVSRMVEQSLSDVDPAIIEASRSMGASNFRIVIDVLLPEARVSLTLGVAVALVSIIGYTAFAYNIAAGGLISEAYSYYNQNPSDPWAWSIWVIIAVIVIVVQLIQEAGLLISRKIDKRRKNS